MSNLQAASARRSRTPIYRAIQSDIQRKILSGELPRGAWLPSEAGLKREYAASQTSVRRALLELARLGLIERYQGRGSIITSNEMRTTTTMLGLGEELRQRGYDITGETIANRVEEASATVAGELAISEGSPVRHLERVYTTADGPLVFLDHYLLPDLVDDFDRFDGASLYAFLLGRNAAPDYAQERVFAANLEARQADLLGVPGGTAALVRERRSFDGAGQVVEFTHYVLRSDRYHLEIDLRAAR